MNKSALNKMASFTQPKSQAPMMQLSSCFLCLFEENELVEFVGPILSDEVEEEIQLSFEDDDERERVQVIDEKLFRIMHAEKYYQDFEANWDIYVQNLGDIQQLEPLSMSINASEAEMLIDEDESKNFFILLPTVGQVMKISNDELALSIFMDADPIHTGQFCAALATYIPSHFTLTIAYEYFATDGNIYTGDEARKMYEKDVMEDQIKNITLNLN